ncbi:MAG: hypothetical protein Q9219_007436 [cf. Caloplaca sp. 3 TL-2023]
MDPLSLAASIIAILGVAKAGCKALDKAISTHRAPAEVTELLGELNRFRTLLEKINELVDPQKGLRADKHLQDLIQHGGKLVGEINTLTTQAWPAIRSLKLSEDNRQRVVVLRNGGKLKTLKEALRITRLDLTAALSLLTASSSIRLADDVSSSAELHQSNSAALSTLLQKVTFIEESTRQLQQATGKLVLPMNEYQSAMSRLDLADSTYGSSIPESVALTLDDLDSTYDGPRRASDPSSEQSKDFDHQTPRCVEWCSCRCHTQSISEFPWILKTLLGHLFIERVSNELPCNEHHCKRSAISSIKLTYHLPRYIMRRYLKFAMHHHPLDGPNISIRLPRVMDWPHELFKQATVGNVRAIQGLFAQGKASPYDVNPRGCNALIYAAAHGNPELGRFLLRAGADPELTDSNGRKPVELFAERAFSGQFDSDGSQVVKNMFEGTNYLESRRFSSLHKIILGLIPRDLEKELEMSTVAINDCDAQGRTPLCWAVIRDDLSGVNILLGNGANPNIADHTGSSCLHFARSLEICRVLIQKNADVHARNRVYSRTALHSFCKRDGTVEMIDQLVAAGLEVNARDADGETPLLNAIFRGFSAAAEKLLNLGADPNACNISSHESSIHFAVSFDRHSIIPMLLKKGADHTATNIRGRTIAHMAARVASARTMETLGSFDLSGLDLSLRDSDGNTAADYLFSRKIVSDSDQGIRRAFAKLQQACHTGEPFHGPHPLEAQDLEGQETERRDRYHLPGAYPEPPGQQDQEKDKVSYHTRAMDKSLDKT